MKTNIRAELFYKILTGTAYSRVIRLIAPEFRGCGAYSTGQAAV
jgi:hypothetical protein